MENRARKALRKKAKKGMVGYPVATIAHYGPTDRKATKMVVSIMTGDTEPETMRKWYSDDTDIRQDAQALAQALAFVRNHDVKSVAMPERIIGCPHEEGIDYPEGGTCSECPFWSNRDCWTGEIIQ